MCVRFLPEMMLRHCCKIKVDRKNVIRKPSYRESDRRECVEPAAIVFDGSRCLKTYRRNARQSIRQRFHRASRRNRNIPAYDNVPTSFALMLSAITGARLG
jgi:hypothetical protein